MQNVFLKDLAKIWPCSVLHSESGEGLGPIKNEDEDLPSAESHAELVRMTHEWISAVTERSQICLIISCRYLWCEIYLP